MRDRNVVGINEVKATAAEVDITKNEMSRVGGASPTQQAIGRLPRAPGSQFDEEGAFDLGVLAIASEDASDEFSRQASLRASARKAFAERDVGSCVPCFVRPRLWPGSISSVTWSASARGRPKAK